VEGRKKPNCSCDYLRRDSAHVLQGVCIRAMQGAVHQGMYVWGLPCGVLYAYTHAYGGGDGQTHVY
jgi:hypothetical protein